MLLLFLIIHSIFLIISSENISGILEISRGYRIIGGIEANKNEWNFLASITTGQVHNCGGALIRPRWVVTAAHCLRGGEIDMQIQTFGKLGVRLGADDLSYKDSYKYVVDMLPGTKIDDIVSVAEKNDISTIEKIYTHKEFYNIKIPNYGSLIGNDIALVKLYSDRYGYTLLDFATKPPTNASVCKIAGWGHTKLNMFTPKVRTNILNEIELRILDKDLCSAVLEQVVNDLRATKSASYFQRLNKICGQGSKPFQAIFPGDSGGPVICDNELHGVACQVTSFRISNTQKSRHILTSIFTDVSFYIDWINEIFEKNGEPPLPKNTYKSSVNRNNMLFLNIVLSILLIVKKYETIQLIS